MVDNPYAKWAPQSAPIDVNPYAKWAPADPNHPNVSTTEDVARSLGAGLRRGVESIPGMGGDLPALGRTGVAKVAGWLGASPETQKAITDYDIPYAPDLPTTDDIHAATTPFIGESYEPKTRAGRYARTAGEFAPGFVSNPLKGALHVGGRLAVGALAGLASEGAGEATEGTKLEPWARAGAGILAGGTGVGALEGAQGARTATRRAGEIAREDAAARQGVRLTKGQRSGNVTQQGLEEEMRRGGRGDAAQRLMQGRDEANTAALNNAFESLSDRVAPTRGADPVQAGDILNLSLRERVQRLRNQGGQDIENALQSGVMVDADRLRSLPGDLQRDLAGPTPYVPRYVLGENTPVANEAISRINTFADQARDPAVRQFSLAGGEALRQRISELQAAPGSTDARALGAIRDHLDDWLDQSGGNANQQVLDQLQQGRDTYRSGARIDRPRKNERSENPGATTVSKMVLSGHPEDTRRLFTPTARGTLTSQATDALDRLAQTGAQQGDLDQIRGIILDQLQTGQAQARSTKINNFINENPTAARLLFSDAEIENLRTWGDTNRWLVVDPAARNPSGTSYPLLREMSKAATQRATQGGAMTGGILGGVPGAIIGGALGKGTELIRELGNRRAAGEALRPADRRSLAQIILEAAGKGARRSTFGINDREKE